MSARRTRIRRRNKNRVHVIWLQITSLILVGVFVLSAASVAAGTMVVDSWLQDLPDYTAQDAFEVARPTRIYSADGKLLARLYLENREVVPISKMSTDLVNAVVSIEDERYYEHNGVDVVGLGRAVVVNLTEGFGEEGASTITQQYVRNTILLDERTEISLARKIREAFLAIQVEKRFTKEQILEMYLNAVYLGQGAYGAQAASKTYFSKPANKLSLAEAATIAGLLQQPSRLDPFINPDGATSRRNVVLRRMLSQGYIDQAEYDEASAAPLTLKRSKEPDNGIYAAHYYVAQVKKQLQDKFSRATVFAGGLTVYTTLDSKMQKYAEDAVKKGLPSSGGAPEGALVSIDPRNGYVKALVGGRDYSKNKFSVATQAHRQPGSSFKTFTLVAALEDGMAPSYSINSGAPAYIPTKPKPWKVMNSEGSGSGSMTLERATQLSVNTVFARVAWAIGPAKVVKTANKMGIRTKLSAYPSIALGAQNVTPLEMASAYGTLANNGVRHDPIFITKVIDRHEQVLLETKPKGKRVVSREISGETTRILQGVITNGTARRAAIGRPAAGKTGTSQDHRDVWFVGYTPQLVTAVWVGHRKEKTIYVNGRRAFGGTVCAPIWADFMSKALKGQKELAFPKYSKPKYASKKFKVPGGGGEEEEEKDGVKPPKTGGGTGGTGGGVIVKPPPPPPPPPPPDPSGTPNP